LITRCTNSLDRFNVAFPPLLLSVGNGMPVELEVPVKPSDTRRLGAAVLILEGTVIEHVDDRSDDVRPILGDAVKQRFQPSYKESRRSIIRVQKRVSILTSRSRILDVGHCKQRSYVTICTKRVLSLIFDFLSMIHRLKEKDILFTITQQLPLYLNPN